MIEWIKSLFCMHVWKEVKHIKLHAQDAPDTYVGDEYIVRCEKCGRMKSFRF